MSRICRSSSDEFKAGAVRQVTELDRPIGLVARWLLLRPEQICGWKKLLVVRAAVSPPDAGSVLRRATVPTLSGDDANGRGAAGCSVSAGAVVYGRPPETGVGGGPDVLLDAGRVAVARRRPSSLLAARRRLGNKHLK